MMAEAISRQRHWRGGLLAAALVITVALAGCGGAGAAVNPPSPPQGWTDITPPQAAEIGQRITYVVSPDTPGLMLALIGGHAQASADPPPTARLWRTRDGGATWEALDNATLRSGSILTMPEGGHGLVLSSDAATAAVSISQDAGTTWRALPDFDTKWPPAISAGWPGAAVMVGARLYAGGVTSGYGGLAAGTARFSVSDDHGFTWRVLETQDDPMGAGFLTSDIAPLDGSGQTFLRVVAKIFDTGVKAALERSTDGGKTWSVAPGSASVFSSLGSFIDARFSTNAGRPGAVCLAMSNRPPPSTTTSSVMHSGAARIGPPPPTPLDVSLLASDDGGLTWRGGVAVRLRDEYGGVTSAGVRMGADGACSLGTTQANGEFDFGDTKHTATFWRLTPGASTPVAVLTRSSAPALLDFVLAPPMSGSPAQIVALARTAGPGDGERISCGSGCFTFRDAGIYRLISEPLPAA